MRLRRVWHRYRFTLILWASAPSFAVAMTLVLKGAVG